MHNPLAEIFGFIGAILGAITLVPEVIKAFKTHHLKDIAWGMLILTTISSVFWVIYGIHLEAYPIMISDSLHLATAALLMYLKYHYSQGNQPLAKEEEKEK